MNAYLPTTTATVAIALAWLGGMLVVGYGIARIRTPAIARGNAWTLLIVSAAFIERLTVAEPAGVRMLAIIAALLWGMKVVVATEAHLVERVRLRPLAWVVFCVAWFGMRPARFRNVPGRSCQGVWPLAQSGLVRVGWGCLLVVVARQLAMGGPSGEARRAAATCLLLVGFSLVVHFGLFDLLAALMRRLGAAVRKLFVAPLWSTSLTEFWGRRWNLAFSEMTAAAVYRPLRRVAGSPIAGTAAFLFSGLLHELAISVPVRAGFGLPLLYFAFHAAAMRLESRWSAGGSPVDRIAWRGRVWTAAWLLVPLPLLFHVWFLEGCVWPLIGVAAW
ncbi:MAG: hypothetical protein DWQ42_07525 [Planctomycetota bacterium]|nr:MAG: hypothetical protein DWQ42_07525 [Planctomycetota bacterium]REK37857.1 MAG: hypothetical protein DWQ46_21585 [Planctomycetota bacterium]